MLINEYPLITATNPSDLLLVQTANDGAYKGIKASNIGGGGNAKYIQLLDTRISGIDGGVAVNSSWTTRVINTIQSDETGLITLANNVFSLPAGVYRIESFSSFYLTNQTKTRLFNAATNTPIIYSVNSYFASPDRGGNNYGYSVIKGTFTLASDATVSLQYYCLNPYSSSANLGGASISDGSPEIYTCIDLLKQ